MHEQSNRRKPSKGGNRRKGRNGNRGPQNGNRAMNSGNGGSQPTGGVGVCVRCGHPAPDGKMCTFHKSLLNSIRNDFGNKRASRTHTPPSPNGYC